ncbi:hypothetical protein [Saccharothrix longispora]|uniref:hypothetical protein n=1 Tax=Saccharothrix longispora TaxID=33920 RepID=UPI0028FD0B2C|nr:hypothetical protein [Saccharothrix longispora]MBY8849191.1 hypothetical protein [Saccharothrix sp. MB29]MDU0294873.1 hypothetical protein [Saccharothrix longispora]
MTDPHTRLLALAGRVPDGWLAVAREALADGDQDQLDRLFAALPGTGAHTGPARAAHRFAPPRDPCDDTDRAVVRAVAPRPVAACWRAVRGGTDAVYLLQAQPGADLPAITVVAQRALTSRGERSPRVEVFDPDAALPAYHVAALTAATLLWSAEPAAPVRVARTFDGASPAEGPYFSPSRELLVEADERQRLLDFLAGGEVVLPVPGALDDVLSGASRAVRADLRSDGAWVWSDASRYYLDRHRVAPDPELAAHAAANPARHPLTHLERHRVRAALTPAREEGPLWRAG